MKFPKIPLNYGTIAGMVYFLLFVLLYYAGLNPLGKWSYLGVWIPFVVIFLGIKHLRDRELGGNISFGKAVGSGMLISFVFASLFGILSYSFGSFIATDVVELEMTELMQQMDEMQIQIDEMKAMGNSSFAESLQVYYNKAAEGLEKNPENFTLSAFLWGDFTGKLYGGFFVSLIIGLILKKKEALIQ